MNERIEDRFGRPDGLETSINSTFNSNLTPHPPVRALSRFRPSCDPGRSSIKLDPPLVPIDRSYVLTFISTLLGPSSRHGGGFLGTISCVDFSDHPPHSVYRHHPYFGFVPNRRTFPRFFCHVCVYIVTYLQPYSHTIIHT